MHTSQSVFSVRRKGLALNDHPGSLSFSDIDSATAYAELAVHSEYGRDRLRAVQHLLEIAQLGTGLTVVDFGGGDGSFLNALELQIETLFLIDISPNMLQVASTESLAKSANFLKGSVEKFAVIDSDSVDVVFCINALGYLGEPEKLAFFEEASRVLRTGGALVVLTGNELIDLFALNSGTGAFFNRHFQSDVRRLLSRGGDNRFVQTNRENPLVFGHQMAAFGLFEKAQAFSQWHAKPPGLALLEASDDYAKARNLSRDHAINPNALPSTERWQALFRCSIFASLSVKP